MDDLLRRQSLVSLLLSNIHMVLNRSVTVPYFGNRNQADPNVPAGNLDEVRRPYSRNWWCDFLYSLTNLIEQWQVLFYPENSLKALQFCFLRIIDADDQ